MISTVGNIRHLVLAGMLALFSGSAAAEYPDKPIEIIVGFAAGGGTDVMARTVAPFLEKYLGEDATIVVKNIPGASGQIGVTEVAHAEPDGYTLGTYSLPGMMARTVDREARYSADNFTFLANVVNDANVIVTSKESGLDTLEKLIESAKANPGAIPVGVSSLGGDDHFALIKLQNLIGAELNVVPFRGSSLARSSLLGGHIEMGIFNISEIVNFQEQVNVLGVAQAEPSKFAPAIPTLKAQGLDLINGSMRGFVAPAGLPKNVEAKLLYAFQQLAEDADFLQAMEAVASPVEMVVGEEFKALNAEALEYARQAWKLNPWL